MKYKNSQLNKEYFKHLHSTSKEWIQRMEAKHLQLQHDIDWVESAEKFAAQDLIFS